MLKHLPLYTCFIAVFLALIPQASAEKILFLSPTRVNLNEKDRVEVINVSNLSDVARAYKISAQDLIMTRDGVTTPVDSFDYSAKRMIRFVPREFILKPGDRQTIRIMSRVPRDAQDGDYHTHIRFLEDVTQRDKLNPRQGEGARIEAPLAYEALIPAVVSKGTVEVTLDMPSLTIKKSGKKYEALATVTRAGNGQGIGHIESVIVNADSTESEFTPRRTVYIYRETDERTKAIDFPETDIIKAGKTVKFKFYDSDAKDAAPIKEITKTLP